MAIFIKYEILTTNAYADRSSAIRAGNVITLDSSTNLVRLANRQAVDGSGNATGVLDTVAFGVAVDDVAVTGNTQINPDPVGSMSVSSGALVKDVQGFYVGAARRFGDEQSEIITNVNNLSDISSGYSTPKRPLSLIAAPATQFLTDRFKLSQTAASLGAYTDEALSGSFAANDILTFGAGATNAGFFVKRTSKTHGMAVAQVISYDSTQGLLELRLLMDRDN